MCFLVDLCVVLSPCQRVEISKMTGTLSSYIYLHTILTVLNAKFSPFQWDFLYRNFKKPSFSLLH